MERMMAMQEAGPKNQSNIENNRIILLRLYSRDGDPNPNPNRHERPSPVTRLSLSSSSSSSHSLLQSPILRPAADVDSNTFRQQLNYFVSPQMLKSLWILLSIFYRRCWLQFLNAMLSHLLLVLCIVGFSHSIHSSPGFRNGGDDRKNLIVGEELWKETIPLQLGSRVYELQGLKSHTWYEVKISYPASIPASFTIQLKKDDSDPGMNRAVRRLLNTEKLIFKSDVILDSNQGKLCVLVRVEPEGVVAIPNVEERKDITFNIVSNFAISGEIGDC
ncbi:CAVEOLIN-1 PROTEIN [Salix viminalis]|uniref:CAVEOLIN-1 PROTEIN n=1 Tax=Salix viminalis TaxID=40686 RepID=A0A9Q0ZQV0_SALVM|nr:CAVEOLIN-1 PROTEIN [Salix viminalis]